VKKTKFDAKKKKKKSRHKKSMWHDFRHM